MTDQKETLKEVLGIDEVAKNLLLVYLPEIAYDTVARERILALVDADQIWDDVYPTWEALPKELLEAYTANHKEFVAAMNHLHSAFNEAILKSMVEEGLIDGDTAAFALNTDR